VTILNGFFDCSALTSTFCFRSTALTFGDGFTDVTTGYQTVAASSNSRISGSPSLYFEYIADSSREGLTGLPILHLAPIRFPYSTIYTLSARQKDEKGAGFEREVIFDGGRSRGCAFTVDSVANYTISFQSVSPASSGRLEHGRVSSFFAAGLYDNLYSADAFLFATESIHSSAPNSATPASSNPNTLTPSETTTATTARGSSSREMTATSSSHMPTPQESDANEMKVAAIVVSVAAALVVLVTAVVWCLCRSGHRWNDARSQSLIESLPDGPREVKSTLQWE
jgi:hypothetical protein